jgi:hypothetical protein
MNRAEFWQQAYLAAMSHPTVTKRQSVDGRRILRTPTERADLALSEYDARFDNNGNRWGTRSNSNKEATR